MENCATAGPTFASAEEEPYEMLHDADDRQGGCAPATPKTFL